ncbi:MAG: hypothetical protein K2G22_05820 [Eubacterium sp.]|nr:hypothetical protein [Eubacterium sp.]
MTEKYIMSENNIPDGMLHDQSLYEISLKYGILTLSFNIFLSKEEYGNSNFAKKYFEYKKCHIRCNLRDESFCNVRFETSLDKKGGGKVQYLSINEFIEIAGKEISKRAEKSLHPWEYLYTYVSPDINSSKIELCIYGVKYKGIDYSMCTLELESKEIEYIWE